MLRKLPLLLLVSLLAGCNVYSKVDLYTADLFDVLEEGASLKAPLTLSFDIFSSNNCEKVQNGLLPPLRVVYGDVVFQGCRNEGMKSYADFQVAAEVVKESADNQPSSNQPIYIGVFKSSDGGPVSVAYFRNSESVAAFTKSVPDKLTRFASKKPVVVLEAVVENDLRNVVKVGLRGVMAGAEAVPAYRRKWYELARRKQIKVRLSDVDSAYFSEGGQYTVIAEISK